MREFFRTYAALVPFEKSYNKKYHSKLYTFGNVKSKHTNANLMFFFLRLFTGVDTHVDCKPTRIGERFLTHLTAKWLLACMLAHMDI